MISNIIVIGFLIFLIIFDPTFLFIATFGMLLVVGIIYVATVNNTKKEIPDINIYSIQDLIKYAPTVFVSPDKMRMIREYIRNNDKTNMNTFDATIHYYASDNIDEFFYNENGEKDFCDKVIIFSVDEDVQKYSGAVFMARCSHYIDGSFKIADVKNIRIGQDGLIKYPDNYDPKIFVKSQNYKDKCMIETEEDYKKIHSKYNKGLESAEFVNKRKYNDIYENVKNNGYRFYKHRAIDYEDPNSFNLKERNWLLDVYLVRDDDGELYHGSISVYPYYDKFAYKFDGYIVYES